MSCLRSLYIHHVSLAFNYQSFHILYFSQSQQPHHSPISRSPHKHIERNSQTTTKKPELDFQIIMSSGLNMHLTNRGRKVDFGAVVFIVACETVKSLLDQNGDEDWSTLTSMLKQLKSINIKIPQLLRSLAPSYRRNS
jgi:hypothetical protein